MATYNAANMVQFNEAIKSCTDGDTIEVLADLDWNDVVDNVTATIKLGNVTTPFTTHGVVINGNNHRIYNMTGNRISSQTYGTYIYDFHSSKAQINDLSFLNCDFGYKDTVIIFSSGSTTDISINNCVLQGRFKYTMFKGRNGSTFNLNNCMITCNWSDYSPFKTATGIAPLFNYCWIRLTDYNAYNAGTGVSYAENLNGCYIDGKLNYVSSGNTPRFLYAVQNSCINVEVNAYQTNDIDVFIVPATGATACNIINIDKISTYSGYELTEEDSSTMNKCCTDTHMKDANYLASVGFDIIP